MHFSNNGIFHGAFFIFIKTDGTLTDQEVMAYLGLENYRLTADTKGKKDYRNFFITKIGDWIHVIDDWFYHLYHLKYIKKNIEFLSRKYDVFYCVLPDSDDSYEFVYYKDNQLVRKCLAEDPNYKGAQIIEDIGTPFPVEKDISFPNKSFEAVFDMATYLGIDVNHKSANIRCYEKYMKTK